MVQQVSATGSGAVQITAQLQKVAGCNLLAFEVFPVLKDFFTVTGSASWIWIATGVKQLNKKIEGEVDSDFCLAI